jgi:hypothetical protein
MVPCVVVRAKLILLEPRPKIIAEYLYTVNDSIKGDANLNIEGLRRTYADLFWNTPMPRTLYIQADNASDNKCWAMVAWLAMLVHHDYTSEVRQCTTLPAHYPHITTVHRCDFTEFDWSLRAFCELQVYLSFLIVGHTHEDIDQLFSVISQFFRKLTHVLTPQQFQQEIAAALGTQRVKVAPITAVLKWTDFLLPCLVRPLPTGIQHATLLQEEGVAGQYGDQKVRSPHTFWIHRRADRTVVLHYKEFCVDPVWLPSLPRPDGGPLVTDEEGIELFQTPPPDPMTTPPTEAELI